MLLCFKSFSSISTLNSHVMLLCFKSFSSISTLNMLGIHDSYQHSSSLLSSHCEYPTCSASTIPTNTRPAFFPLIVSTQRALDIDLVVIMFLEYTLQHPVSKDLVMVLFPFVTFQSE